MLLTEYNIFYYLLDKGMADTASVIRGEFSARRSDSRNNNFLINREYGRHSYFIKQVKAPDQEKIDTLRAEAACYQLAQEDKRFAALKQSLPRFFLYDHRAHILVVEQIKEMISLHDHYFGYHQFENDIPQKLARILAAYHKTSLTDPKEKDSAPLPFPRRKPWVFTIATQPPEMWMGAQPSAEQQTMQMIFKNAEFVQLLLQCENEWAPFSLVHNDIKFTNFLVRMENEQPGELKLIDWELADIGDPLWDVAGIFLAYLQLWITTDLPEKELQLYPHIKRITLPQVQPCMDSFWQAYTQEMGFDAQTAWVLLQKAVKFTALKLLHACFETAPYAKTLQPNGAKMLQISFNILRSPANAAAQLMGIKPVFA